MKKYVKRIVWVIVVLLLIPIIYMAIYYPPVMSGMTAKMTCSCVYVMGRTVESVREKELQVFPGLSMAGIEIGSDSSVTAQILWSTGKAIYRKGLGCMLLAERSESEIRNQKLILPTIPAFDQDTIAWPRGNLLSKNSLNVDYPKINSILDSAFIDDPEKPLNTLGIVIVYDGQIIGEKYAEGFSFKSKMMGWSMGKSITSALIGILAREEKLIVIDEAPVPEWQNDDRKNITLDDLLKATSGLAWEEGYLNPRSHFHNMFTYSDDKAAYAASQKLKKPIGTAFQYSSGTTNILSRIIRQTVGDSAYYKFPFEKLFYKIGMNGMVLEPDASGTFVGSSYVYGTARDWARFGLLYLNDGYWIDERILPEGWIEYTTTPSAVAPLGEYGAQWWLNVGEKNHPEKRMYPLLPTDTFWADGFEEQYVMVISSKNLVVVRLGISHHGSPFEKMVSDIIKCLPEEN